MSGPRHRAREAALRILYFWEVGGAAPDDAIETFFAEHAADAPADVRAFAADLVHVTIDALPTIDATIARHSHNWRIERLPVVDRLILRLAVAELTHGDTPPASVIDEALELARRYSTEDAVRFINGVLDGVSKRRAEPPVAPG